MSAENVETLVKAKTFWNIQAKKKEKKKKSTWERNNKKKTAKKIEEKV